MAKVANPLISEEQERLVQIRERVEKARKSKHTTEIGNVPFLLDLISRLEGEVLDCWDHVADHDYLREEHDRVGSLVEAAYAIEEVLQEPKSPHYSFDIDRALRSLSRALDSFEGNPGSRDKEEEIL